MVISLKLGSVLVLPATNYSLMKEVNILETANNTENVLQAVKEAAPEGWINCADARKLAGKLGVELAVIGKACDELNIKIKNCQLGCF